LANRDRCRRRRPGGSRGPRVVRCPHGRRMTGRRDSEWVVALRQPDWSPSIRAGSPGGRVGDKRHIAAVAPFGRGMPRSRETALLVRPSLPLVAACLVRSDSPRLLRNWRVCRVVVTDCRCAPAFLAGCGTRSARHAAPLFRDGRMVITECHAGTTLRRAVRSDRVALCCAALGVAKAARTAHSEAGASPAERRT
jgi:hypothetical protein